MQNSFRVFWEEKNLKSRAAGRAFSAAAQKYGKGRLYAAAFDVILAA